MKTRLRTAKVLRSAGIAVTLAVAMVAAGGTAYAAGPATVGLGTAAPFAILAGTAVTNSGPSVITGNLGISPGAATAVTGFPPGTVSGSTEAANPVAVQAQSDLTTAYTVAKGLPAKATHATLGNLTLVGGVYNAGGATLSLTGTLTLDGQNDANSVWVFQATSDLVTASSSKVALINGASSCNVFWQVTSSATLGSGSTFVGTILALTSITMADGVAVNGRALARNGEVTLINDKITSSPCVTGAAAASPAASATPAASTATPRVVVPATDTVGAPPQGGDLPWLLILVVASVVASLAVGFGLRGYRRPAR